MLLEMTVAGDKNQSEEKDVKMLMLFYILPASIFLLSAYAESETDSCKGLQEFNASSKGTISSPFYGKGPYSKKFWCEYRIRAPPGHRIRITFKDFDISDDDDDTCTKDKLAIYTTDKQGFLAEFCGSELPRPLMSKKGESEINILFYTRNTTSGGRGFLLEYDSSPTFNDLFDDYACRDVLEYDATTPGTMSSPFYGEFNYSKELYCQYKITAPEGYRIKITFKDMDIEAAQGCRKDKLDVYSKKQESQIAILCGDDLPRPLLSKEGENEMLFLFYTDAIVSGRGFLLQYESSPYFTSVCEDGKKVCANRNCYTAEQTCDGVDDCGDGTDEEDCGRPINTEPEKCGVQEFEPDILKHDLDRIVGGEEAVPHSWPWQVSLQYLRTEPSNHFCGGTLINEQWVMTALHCISALRYPRTLKVRIGAHNLLKRSEYEQERTPIKIIVYPDLQNDDIKKKGDMKHDIALLKLNAPVKFNKGVQPACLPSSDMPLQTDQTCYSTGWGETRGSGGGGNRLKQSEMVVQSRIECGFYEDAQVCVAKPYHSTCHGDSGSPINCKVGDKWYSYGALSLLVPTNLQKGLCAGADAKTLYASSSLKAEWIKEIVKKYS